MSAVRAPDSMCLPPSRCSQSGKGSRRTRMNKVSKEVFEPEAALPSPGLRFEVGQDVSGFVQAYGLLSAGHAAPPPLSNEYVDIDRTDFQWIRAVTTDAGPDTGVVGIVASRRERIDEPLAEHLNKEYPRLYKGEGPLKITGHAPAAWNITGTLVYHGGLLIDPAHRSSRLGCMLSRLAISKAQDRWQPDYHWAYIAKAFVDSAFHKKAGYSDAQERGVWFEGTPKGVASDDCLVWRKGSPGGPTEFDTLP